ncbi:MAG: GNAT family N-acetyltransferase [Candidatus Heimdallarchaeota archaeon]|nr:GNAT family N-acetyltransferase [Candidatus Heimdallarchaeota archaeon]
MEIKIITNIDNNPVEMVMFFDLPQVIYSNDPIWMGENSDEITRYIKQSKSVVLIAVEQTVIYARVICILNNKAIVDGKQQGWLGYFECLKNQQKAGKELLDAACMYLKQNDFETVVGPKLDNLRLGLQIKGFNHPQSILSNYNPKYYQKIFKKAGFKIAFRTYAFYLTRKIIQKFNFEMRNDIVTREFKIDDLENEIKIFASLNQQIFAGNNDYVPRTFEEERQLVHSLLPIIDPKLIIIAEHENKPIGMIVSILDANQKKKEGKIDRLRIISIGVLPEWHRKKVGAMLGAHLMRNGMPMENLQYAEASFILDHNIPSQLLAKRFNARVGRTFALFKKEL